MTNYDPAVNPFSTSPSAGNDEPQPSEPATDTQATPRRQRPDKSGYRQSAKDLEQLGRSVLRPLQLAGHALSGFLNELLGVRTIALAGSLIAVFGVSLAVEAYWHGLTGNPPFLPKLGISDGATLANLDAVFNGSSFVKWQFGTVVVIAIVAQLLEVQPLRQLSASKKRLSRKRSPLGWVAIGLAYALDLYCGYAMYLADGWNIPGAIWFVVTVCGAELGLSLARDS